GHATAQLELASRLVESASKADEHSSALARIPPSVTTEIRTPGLYDALIATRDFKGALDALPAEKRVRIIQEYVTTRSGQTPGQQADDDLPGHAAGTNYVPFTGPAILHQGEMVIPAAQAANMRRGGGGGGMIVLAPVILDAGAYTDATGSVAYSDIGSVVLQRLEGTL
ncbi:MAG: hypothetical protein ABIH03_08725, partial [Pseudomonadota bacterium]